MGKNIVERGDGWAVLPRIYQLRPADHTLRTIRLGRARKMNSGGREVLFALLVACALTLTSCARPERSLSAGSITVPEGSLDTQGADVFAIDPDHSSVTILVFRSGPLARFGHNHVVTTSSLSGHLWVHPELERSKFEIQMPVSSLVVDDERLRAQHGAEFSSHISQEDIAKTRRNMLGPNVLDAERFPLVHVRSAGIVRTSEGLNVVARITLKGVERDVLVPIELARDGRLLRAKGQFDIRQSDFGIKPFSVALGALAVQDLLHVELQITARRASS